MVLNIAHAMKVTPRQEIRRAKESGDERVGERYPSTMRLAAASDTETIHHKEITTTAARIYMHIRKAKCILSTGIIGAPLNDPGSLLYHLLFPQVYHCTRFVQQDTCGKDIARMRVFFCPCLLYGLRIVVEYA